ncbi:MAG: hypothetical protein ACLSB9_24340 [Hydrogeniiclostridium mannosilyticum]
MRARIHDCGNFGPQRRNPVEIAMTGGEISHNKAQARKMAAEAYNVRRYLELLSNIPDNDHEW